MKPAFKVLSLLFLVLIFGIMGCQTNSPDSPLTDLTIKRSQNQLHFLQPQKSNLQKVFKTEQYITVASGGTIFLGDEDNGYCSLDFKPGDLTENTLIAFTWNSQNFIADLGPHGIQFNNPVRLTLSYKDANVSTVQEEGIRVWYYNEPETNWELIGGEVNAEEQQVETYIGHFSRYALAGED